MIQTILNNIKLGLASLLIMLGLLWAVAPAPTYAAPSAAKNAACSAIGDCSSNPEKSINNTVKTAINIITVVVGIVAVIMIIVAGAKFVTSGGDSSKVSSAKSSLVYAIIGLVIVVLAQVIVRFVLTKTAN